ncbi:hypothetical protein HanHA300_Chr17g0641271 [Helianthus annuus]|nr:hypothetical protein HanHA300_Chr17g0641271 [Helianthus annuus]KAJ0446305.1 hypothetical protein HanHA89_Chr17g0692861 [Helianthus annuus]KAJ0631260.1 hypothetical protein HanLR1_Chr17g0652071 [Helianthus annuus]
MYGAGRIDLVRGFQPKASKWKLLRQVCLLVTPQKPSVWFTSKFLVYDMKWSN